MEVEKITEKYSNHICMFIVPEQENCVGFAGVTWN